MNTWNETISIAELMGPIVTTSDEIKVEKKETSRDWDNENDWRIDI